MSTIRRIVGPTILLGSGTYFDYENPEDAYLTLEDVAWGLACTGRFRGQCVNQTTGERCFYSVAEHCVRGAWSAPEGYQLAFLLHELGEVTCGDMPAPLKSIMPEFRAMEDRCEVAGMRQFRVPEVDRSIIKYWDLVMLRTEQRDLMPAGRDVWISTANIKPLPLRIIETWTPEMAAKMFRKEFYRLALERNDDPRDIGAPKEGGEK